MEFDVLVIAMQRETERRAFISESLAKAGVTSFSFLDATDGKSAGGITQIKGYKEEKAKEVLGRELTPSEIACFDSHRRAWQHVASHPKPTLILESDALIDSNTISVCGKLCRMERPSWEVVMLYYHECIPSVWQRHVIDASHKLVKFANKKAYISSSILMSAEGARKLLTVADEIYVPADDFISGGHIDKDINLYAVYPRAARLGALAQDSSIQDEREVFGRNKIRKDGAMRRLEQRVRRFMKALKPPKKGL